MRDLRETELTDVSGAGRTYGEVCPPVREKGNNGWGNGGDDGVPNRHNEKFDGVDEDRR